MYSGEQIPNHAAKLGMAEERSLLFYHFVSRKEPRDEAEEVVGVAELDGEVLAARGGVLTLISYGDEKQTALCSSSRNPYSAA